MITPKKLLFLPALGMIVALASTAFAQDETLNVMQAELVRSMQNLAAASDVPMYYLQYSITDQRQFQASVNNGGFEVPNDTRTRYLDVDIRVGGLELDNTHEIRGGNWRDNYQFRRTVETPLAMDADALRAALWDETEYQSSQARERYTKVLANRQVKVEEEDLSNDFSPAEPHQYSEAVTETEVDTAYWFPVMRRIGKYFTEFAFIQTSSVSLAAKDVTHYMVNSEGSSLQYGNHYLAFRMEISGMADDGMNLERDEMYCAASFGNMPDEAKITADAERIVKELEALLTAPVVQPYSGPAILRNRASGVFFHEIFGHRIEGHRQKSSQEGQTFTKKVNEQILPQYISIYDDPTLEQLNGEDLRGYYRFDDEGVPAQRVTVVEKGVLKNFLMSRSPIENFSVSNGHGRRDHGNDIVSRQGNMIIHSEKTVPFDALRRELIEECKRQNKPYGLIFDDISGGFTMMQRWAPQAFKVKPLLVHRVYTDGRPDEVVRGVDIVGTPLTSFSKILMTADDTGVFNGSCGAESGMVPVSGISPSILVSEIEVEKRQKGQEKAPILPPPLHDQGKAKIGE